MNYQDFDAASLMQQAPANFLSPETMASMPSFSSMGPSFDTALDSYFPTGQGFQGYSNLNLAGSWMDMLQPITRFGIGGAMEQPDNSGSLPGATTTLPASPEQPKPVTATQATDPFGGAIPEGVDKTTAYVLQQLRAMKQDGNTDWREQADYIFDKRREEAERANKMGQWNTILAAGLKLPDKLNDALARRNMYLGDMLRSQADAAREQAAGIRQSIASMPGAPARNYIRI
jgi:hypothetical protein